MDSIVNKNLNQTLREPPKCRELSKTNTIGPFSFLLGKILGGDASQNSQNQISKSLSQQKAVDLFKGASLSKKQIEEFSDMKDKIYMTCKFKGTN